MRSEKFAYGWLLLGFLVATVLIPISTASSQQRSELGEREVGSENEAPQRRRRRGFPDGVYKGRITPHWLADNTRFWYRNDLRGSTKEFILVDAEKGDRKPAFDHGKLAAALSQAASQEYVAQRLPFNDIEFAEDRRSIQFTVGETVWKCHLETYECTKTGAAATTTTAVGDDSEATNERFRRRQSRRRFSRRRQEPPGPVNSPDSKWSAVVRDGNLYLRSLEDQPEVQLSDDGSSEVGYGRVEWAPDSKTVVAFRIEPGDRKEVHLIESSPEGGGRAQLRSRPYALPGDKYPAYELNLFDVTTGKQTRPEVERIDFGRPRLRWKADGHRFTYEKIDRGHQRFRMMEIDSRTGEARTIIDEKSETFIWTAHTENVRLSRVNELEKTDEIIYASERDGWRHLYLIDSATGEVKNRITRGEYVVRGIDRIDEEKRQIWFQASGKNPDQDPYLMHYYRVNFDGSGLVALTSGNGNHSIQYSPDRRFIIDSYSRVDMAPVHELRRVSDGKLVCDLEKADIAQLKESGWEPPEVFVAKGRDGTTDIWGLIYRPRNLDPTAKYPIIEDIYAGPQGSFVPKRFSGSRRYSSLLDRGFIVVKIDGMGTANRSKAFHDVCWKNLKDGGFPDRILWIQAAAQEYPYMDTARVGIYGTSAGGQNAAAAVLFHPKFYQAAVAASGCHDNRMDKASWNEQWMGYPVGPQYSECSNIDNAHRLEGHLMLIVGEMDTNVPPESTLRFADALIKADKDFDLIVIPGAGHTGGGSYGARRRVDFFVRHLKGVEPSRQNVTSAAQISRPTEAAAQEPEYSIDLGSLAPDNNRIPRLAARYEADRANLERFYSIRLSPTHHARMRKFYSGWITELDAIDADSLTDVEREPLAELKDTVQRDAYELEGMASEQANIVAFVPFAATILDLAEARQRVEKMDPAVAAGRLIEMTEAVKKAHESLRLSLESPSEETQLSRHVLGSIAEATDRLREVLKEWFDFYNGYHPGFTWWMRSPYAEAEEALEEYAAYLEEVEEKGDSLNVELASDTGGAPDLEALVERPPGLMEAVIEKFQSERVGVSGERGGRFFRPSARRGRTRTAGRATSQSRRSGRRPRRSGRGGGARTQSPEERARAERFYIAWQAALDQLDFESMQQADRVDLLLLKNYLSYRLKRLSIQPESRDRQRSEPRDPTAIVGRPIGREALLAELEHEMIPYTPEELIAIGQAEYRWCEAELKRASQEMGFGDEWKKAVDKVKSMHVEPGRQPELIRELAWEAIEYLEENALITVPAIARETWRMRMMSPERQLVNPFFTGGEVISVSFPTDTMSHTDKLQSMRGNNIPFARATVHHELIPGHHLQGFMTRRHRPYRRMFSTPFWGEGWALYWEMVLYARGFPKTPEDRIGFLVWRSHRCARIIFSLSFHLGLMTPEECIDLLVERVGFERNNATAEVRRSVGASPLYQAAYMLGGLQIRRLRQELVETGAMGEREFHDAILREGQIPIEMVRAILTRQALTPDFKSKWRFYDLPSEVRSR